MRSATATSASTAIPHTPSTVSSAYALETGWKTWKAK